MRAFYFNFSRGIDIEQIFGNYIWFYNSITNRAIDYSNRPMNVNGGNHFFIWYLPATVNTYHPYVITYVTMGSQHKHLSTSKPSWGINVWGRSAQASSG